MWARSHKVVDGDVSASVNSTVSPSGNKWGPCASPSAIVKGTSVVGVPPSGETRMIPMPGRTNRMPD
jgi:hypothetical protein